MQPTAKPKHGSRSPLKRIIHNSGWNVMGMVLTVALNFVSLVILAKRLGAEMLGFYFAIVAVSIVVHLVFGCGIATVVTSRIARDRSKLRQHVREGTGLLLLMSSVSIAVFVLCGVIWLQFQDIPLHWLAFAMMGCSVAGRQMWEFAAGGFRGIERFEYENILAVVQTLIFASGVYALVPEGQPGLFWALASLTVSNVVSGVLLGAILMWQSGSFGFTCRLKVVRDWLGESVPLGIGDVMRRLSWQVDTLLLSFLTPAPVVGLYSLAYRPLHPLQLVPMTIASATFPSMSRWVTSDRKTFSRAYGLSLSALWIVSLPICVAIAIVAKPLVVLSAGSEYLGAVIPLRIIVAMVPFIFISTQLRFVLLALNAQKRYWQLTTLVLLGKIVVGLSLIPIFGLYGACVGTVLAEVALASFALLIARHHGVGSPPWRCMFRAMLAVCVMGLFLWPFRESTFPIMVVAVLFATMIYFCLCIVFRALETEVLLQMKTAAISFVTSARTRTLSPSRRDILAYEKGNIEPKISPKKTIPLEEECVSAIDANISSDLSDSPGNSIILTK